LLTPSDKIKLVNLHLLKPKDGISEQDVVGAFKTHAVRALELVQVEKEYAKHLINELRKVEHFHQLDRKFSHNHH
jgi:hypothetical protein